MARLHYLAFPNLIAEIVRAYPPALCVASVTTRWNPEPSRLPFEATTTPGAAVVPPALDVEEDTWHMALAVVEYVIGATALADPRAAWFRRHLLDNTVAAVFSAANDAADDVGGSSTGFAVAKAIHRYVASDRSRAADLLRALFCQGEVPRLLRGSDAVRDTVMGRTAVDLYKMNRRGRFSDPATLLSSAAHHHAGLLGLVSDNVECVYLHVREHWIHLLHAVSPTDVMVR
jgi:hypothetical protein